MPRRLAASLFLLSVAISTSSALRSLQQTEALPVYPAQGPAVPVASNIQLNAPGRNNLLNAPALAPSLAPLPAGVVSLAVKRNSNSAAGAESQTNPQTFDTTTVPVRLILHTCKGSFVVINFTQASVLAKMLKHASTRRSDVTRLSAVLSGSSTS